MKKFLLVNYTPIDRNEELMDVPYLWLTLHSYFKRNSIDPTAWQFLDPIYSPYANSPEELVDQIVSQNPDVLGISCYIWNNSLTTWVAEQVKLKLPDVKIIAGGPSLTYWKQQDWFKKHWYIDLVCNYTGYGEIFITDYLDGKKLKDIAYSVYPDLGRTVWNESSVNLQPRDFKWPMPYKDNIEYLKRFKEKHSIVKFTLDTSRGCPYGCVFCEWGGGTSTKVSFKPLSAVIEELELAFELLQPKYIDVNNANFGISKDDLFIAQKICELHQQYNNCVADVDVYGPSKTSKPRLKEIMILFAKNKVVQDIKISIQSTDKTILDNIKRIDMPFDDQREMFKPVADQYNLPMKYEIMMGLPGETLDTYYKTLSDLDNLNAFPMIHEWIMIDSSPADKEPYFTDMKIKTKTIVYHKHIYTSHLKPKGFQNIENGFRNIVDDIKFKSADPPKFVVGTYSYTEREWGEMLLAKYMITFLYKSKTMNRFVQHIKDKNLPVDDFFKTLVRDYLLQLPTINVVYNKLLKCIESEETLDPYYVDIADNLPYFSYYSLLKFIVLLNPKKFYTDMGSFLAEKYNDDYFLNLGESVGNSVRTPMNDSNLSPREKMTSVISNCQVIENSIID